MDGTKNDITLTATEHEYAHTVDEEALAQGRAKFRQTLSQLGVGGEDMIELPDPFAAERLIERGWFVVEELRLERGPGSAAAGWHQVPAGELAFREYAPAAQRRGGPAETADRIIFDLTRADGAINRVRVHPDRAWRIGKLRIRLAPGQVFPVPFTEFQPDRGAATPSLTTAGTLGRTGDAAATPPEDTGLRLTPSQVEELLAPSPTDSEAEPAR